MEQIVNGIILIIIGLVGVAIGYIIPHINNGLTALSSNEVLKSWAIYLIKYAQEFISRDGKTKMDWVVMQLVDLAKKSNVKITDEQVRVLSEGIYNEIAEEVRKITFNGETKYKLVFEIPKSLSTNEIAKLLHDISPSTVYDHQQTETKLIILCGYKISLEIIKTVIRVATENSEIHLISISEA